MFWSFIVEIIAIFIPKKQRYEKRRFLRSLWNYLYVKNKAAKFSEGFSCGHSLPCSISKKTYIEKNVSIGSCYVMGSGNFIIGENTHIGPMLVVATDNHNIYGEAIPFDKTVIKKELTVHQFNHPSFSTL